MAHNISRRNFLKIGAAGAATAVLAGCKPQRPWVILEPHVRPPEQELAGVATWFASSDRVRAAKTSARAAPPRAPATIPRTALPVPTVWQ